MTKAKLKLKRVEKIPRTEGERILYGAYKDILLEFLDSDMDKAIVEYSETTADRVCRGLRSNVRYYRLRNAVKVIR